MLNVIIRQYFWIGNNEAIRPKGGTGYPTDTEKCTKPKPSPQEDRAGRPALTQSPAPPSLKSQQE
ncbi:uncharacterized protein FOMMEDRAFT_160869 [Fomitiporia mediterranea MF3/22]|uniref:uncharacterized protein n=1 Tax=Fomitiporia mediterranea (strain MF3/22) TaxID=694068 RepID=UPI0004407B16|nr:uncharacterized protein FOMMEDRAFT_160869 [Fomitiporia mediterranea MF3/22]EJC99267.1 hypothetical protein FOMMEDRAFT_160869 [Fomitiporia mediterranea MF3/22]